MQNNGGYKHFPHIFWRNSYAPHTKDGYARQYDSFGMEIFKRYTESEKFGQRGDEEGGRDEHSSNPAVFEEVPYSQHKNACKGVLIGNSSVKLNLGNL